MTPWEAMDRFTHRQYLHALRWLDRWERGETYLVRIAAEIRRVLSTDPGSIKEDDFRVKFTEDKTKRVGGKRNKSKQERAPLDPPGPLTKDDIIKINTAIARFQVEQSYQPKRDGKGKSKS